MRGSTLSARRLAALLIGTALAAVPATAQEISVISGGAVKSALTEAAALYQKRAATRIALEFQPMGPLLRSLAAGQMPDIVVLTREAMVDAEQKGWIVAGSATEIGRVGIGVAVHEAASAPDISSPEALKRTLLAARSIVYIDPARGTSGRHFAEVLATLGIAEAIRPKTILGQGGYVVEPVGRGEIELGVHQSSEILAVKGVKLVGPLPEPLQKITLYEGAVTAKARDPAAAGAFLAYLRAPEARALFAGKGFIEPR